MKFFPSIQVPRQVWERKEIVIYTASTADYGVKTLSPTDTNGTVKSATLHNTFDLATNLHGFDYPLFEDDNVEEVDVANKDDDDRDDDFCLRVQ